MAEIEKLEAIARAATPEGWTSQDIATFSPERVLALLAVVRAAKEAHRVMAELLPNEPETYALELAFDALEQT